MTGILAAMQHRRSDVPAIRTERVELVSMSLAFMKALAAGDIDAATREMDAALPRDLRAQLGSFLSYRIPALEADPASQPWLGRTIVWTHPDGRRVVIGTIGFHAPPDATGRVEIGYRVETAFRRQGIATETLPLFLCFLGLPTSRVSYHFSNGAQNTRTDMINARLF